MKKLLISVGIAMLFSINVLAQEIHYGVYAGGSVNMMNIGSEFYYDDSEVYTTAMPDETYTMSYLPVTNAKIHPNGGFTLGGLFEYKANDFFSLQFELIFNQYGYKMTGTVEQHDLTDDQVQVYDYTANLKMSDFSGALMAKLYVVNNLLTIDLGVMPSFCFRDIKDTKRGISHKTVVYHANKDYNPLNFSALGGLTFYFFDTLFLSARYVYGFTDVLKTRHPYLPQGSTDSQEMELHYNDASSKASSVVFTLGFRM
ncbi:MAG: PorT family protein [Bacteroidales bacterium]|nr:PorT family protein [Bacteroidales bacterium]